MVEEQPTFMSAAKNRQEAANEINLIPNTPAMQREDLILKLLQEIRNDSQQLRADFQCLRDDIQRMGVRLKAVEDQVQTLSFRDDVLPLRLYNFSKNEIGISLIRYPPGHSGFPCPRDVVGLYRYSKDRCLEVINNLGIQPAPLESHVQVFRKQIADYLGIIFVE